MSLVSFAHVTIVGPRDRDLETLLQACGMRSTSVPASELLTLAHPGAKPAPLLVVDLRDTRQFPPALALLKRHHPATAIILVASTLDPAMMLDAMRAGVTECIVEPLSERELRAALERVGQHLDAPTAGEVFVFVGAKGGVGTTTAAVNVATFLAQNAPGKTLLIDLHLANGDAALLCGVDTRFSVIDALDNTHRLDGAFFQSLVTPTKDGPDLLASSDQPAVGRAHSTDRVKALIECAARLYPYVVIDASRSDATTLDAFDKATRLLLLANQELPTVRRAVPLLTMLQERYGRERVDVVLVRYDKQAEISQEDVERVIGVRVKHVVPSDYRLALRALNAGQPLAQQPNNKLSAAFQAIASDLAGLDDAAPSTGPTGLLGRLAGRRG